MTDQDLDEHCDSSYEECFLDVSHLFREIRKVDDRNDFSGYYDDRQNYYKPLKS